MPSERILFDSPLIRMGHFCLGPDEPLWSQENIIGGTLVVFPAVPVVIHQAEREPVVADRTIVMYYNEGQPYRRGLLHERGDEAIWIAFKSGVAGALLAETRPEAAASPEAPFDRSHGPSPDGCYLRHRALADVLEREPRAPALAVEEATIAIVRDLLEADARSRRLRPGAKLPGTDRDRRRLAEEVRLLLASDPGSPWSLDAIAVRLCASPTQLCRVFREHAGSTIHRYLTRLRLREAAAAVLAGEDDLTALALRLGYSNHSHFTEAFRRAFGVPPSRLRDRATVRGLALRVAAG